MAKTIKIIPKNFAFPEAIILDNSEKWITELYQEADRKTAEKFGKNSLAYKTITKGIDTKNITGSQFFWNTNLGLYLSENEKVISLKDMEEINDLDGDFFKEFYTDFPQVILRTDKPSLEKNKYILENLVKQVKKQDLKFSAENPLVISNLELIEDENSKNEYGLLLKIGKDTRLENDSRFASSNDCKQIPFGKKQKTIYTIDNGLSGVCLDRDGDLYAGYDGLASSYGYGRVVLKDAEGTQKNSEAYTHNQIAKVLNAIGISGRLEKIILDTLKK